MIRLLIADDHEMLLDGLSSALARAPDITLAGRASDGLLALHLLRDERPDVALLDVHMPVRTGMDVLRAARHEGLPTRIVLMTSFDDDPTYREALALGAHGFLGKSAGVQRVLAAVRAVARGETSFESGIGERARRAQRPSSGEPPPRKPPHPPRTRDPPPDRDRPLQPRDRRAPRHQRGHRQEPDLQHPHEARGPRQNTSSAHRPPRRLDLTSPPHDWQAQKGPRGNPGLPTAGAPLSPDPR